MSQVCTGASAQLDTFDYLNLCVDMISPAKTECCYRNYKPWVIQEVKCVLNRKKVAFRTKDGKTTISVQQEIK